MPQFTVDQALANLQVWEHATRTQAVRVLASEDALGLVAKGDVYLFVVSLRNVRRSSTLVRSLADSRTWPRIDAANAAFDAALPGAKDARDVIEHFDEYWVGEGYLQRDAPHPRVLLEWIEATGGDVRFALGLSRRLLIVSVRDAGDAASKLRVGDPGLPLCQQAYPGTLPQRRTGGTLNLHVRLFDEVPDAGHGVEIAWSPVALPKAEIDRSKFNSSLALPFSLRLQDFQSAMQDVYDFFFDVNTFLVERGLQRLDEMLRPANLSGTLSDMVTESLAKHSRVLTVNLYHNGHPDLIVQGRYPNDSIKSGAEGVEIKSTRKTGGAVDTHGARNQTMCVFVYEVDNDRNKPADQREPLVFREIYLAEVTTDHFRRNPRGELGTRTATLDAAGIAKFREGWVYKDVPARSAGNWRQAAMKSPRVTGPAQRRS